LQNATSIGIKQRERGRGGKSFAISAFVSGMKKYFPFSIYLLDFVFYRQTHFAISNGGKFNFKVSKLIRQSKSVA
jgi:hypothetical protein